MVDGQQSMVDGQQLTENYCKLSTVDYRLSAMDYQLSTEVKASNKLFVHPHFGTCLSNPLEWGILS